LIVIIILQSIVGVQALRGALQGNPCWCSKVSKENIWLWRWRL